MQTFTQVLYRLLDNPEYTELLRQEVESVVAKDGWTKAGLDKMHNVDSFIRESQRLDVLAISPSAHIRSILVINVCSCSGGITPRPSPFHVLQRRDHSSRYARGAPAPCDPHG
jgi:hypothetical protein